jgi:hypothetical protein
MNEKTEKLLETAVTKGLELAEKTGQFVMEQSPVLLKEFYAWHLYSGIAMVVLFTIAIGLCVKGLKITMKEGWEDAQFFFLGAFSGIGICGFSIAIIVNSFDVLKMVIAPRLYLIEFFIK